MNNIASYITFIILVLGLPTLLQAQPITVRDFCKAPQTTIKHGVSDSVLSLLPSLKKERTRYLTYIQDSGDREDIIRGSIYIFLWQKGSVELNEQGDTVSTITYIDLCDTLMYMYHKVDKIFVVMASTGACFDINSDDLTLYVFDKDMLLSASFQFSYSGGDDTELYISLYRPVEDYFEVRRECLTIDRSHYEYTIDELFELIRMKRKDRDNKIGQWKRSIVPCSSNAIFNAFCSCCHE